MAVTLTPPSVEKTKMKYRTPAGDALRRLTRHRSAQVGFALLALLVFMAIFAPVIAPYDPTKVLKDVKRREPPCIHLLGCPADKPEHIFGIDGNRRLLVTSRDMKTDGMVTRDHPVARLI